MAEKTGRRGRGHDVSLGGFIIRLIAALVLVFATYNPSGYSFVDWIRDAMADGTLGALHFFLGVLLLIGWTIYGVASIRALGTLGLILGSLFFGGLVWVLIEYEILKLDSASGITWVVLVCLAALLAVGVSWSHIWRRMTGQLEVDED